MNKKRIISLLLIFCMVFSLLPLGVLKADATQEDEQVKEDAMDSIKSDLNEFKLGQTQTIADDGYIGIPVEISIYFDSANYTVRSGYGGTPVIIYVVNTYAERVGTDTDSEIIESMLRRGYVVTVLDYKNDVRAVSPDLDWSVQGIRNDIKAKKYFNDPVFPQGTYYDNYVVPAGCNVSLYNVFWEADKHGVDGTLEKIVEIWNTDFRGVKGEKLVKWVYSDGTRKSTLDKANDGIAPVWYDANGNVDASGEYTKVKYTVANSITDCVNPDGSFIDLDLYIHIVYPTNPAKPVPVMSLANSSGYLANSAQTADRPHMNGFLFNGYAGVLYDYLYVPMANDNSFGYYDGDSSNGSLTGDSLTYSVQVYNDKLINTAAMRYIRYLALSDSATFNFDINAMGVFGNSKGGYISFLGEKVVSSPLISDVNLTLAQKENAIDLALSAFHPYRYLDGHHGETRYQIGKTAAYTDRLSGFTVNGGELQPWLTYNGNEIISGAQFTYVGNGADSEAITAGRSPMIVSVHMEDSYNAAYGESNRFANLCRSLNIPSVIFEVPLGHTLSYGEDLDYGIDTYDTIFRFIGYYFKNNAVSVLYTTPLNRAAGVNVTDKITVKFAGEVSYDEIVKVSISGGGETLAGAWTSSYGDTEWTFTPYSMKGGVTYSINVPADLKGKNGVEMGESYTSTFIAEYDDASAAVSTVTSDSGNYFSFTAPSAMAIGANGYSIRFFVANNAANIAELYAVDYDSFDPSSPDSASVGELVGSVNLKGSGSYEIDVTDYVAQRAGKRIVLFLKAQKTAGTAEILYIDYSDTTGNCSNDKYASVTVDTTTFDGNAVYKVVLNNNEGKFEAGNQFYQGVNTAFTLKGLLGKNITDKDYGRQFVFSVRVYDTVSRTLQLRFDTNTNRLDYATRDYDFTIVNVKTKANEWITVELPYTVYDTDYGKIGEKRKDMTFRVGSTGDLGMPIYFDDVKVTETVTEMQVGAIVFAQKNDGGIAYKAPEGENSFALYNGSEIVGEYTTWKSALSAYKSGYVLKLCSNYTLVDADLYSGFGSLSNASVSDGLNVIDINLNGYTVTCANTNGSLLWLKTLSDSIERTEISIYGGAILLDRTSLVSYEDSYPIDELKYYDINLTDVYVSTVKGAILTQALSSDSIADGATVSVNIDLVDCVLDFPDDKHSFDSIELLTAGLGDLDVSYTLDGGCIRLSAMKFVSIQNDASISEFVNKVSGEYTSLILPASKKANGTSYRRQDGFAIYASSGEADAQGFVTFNLSKSENSTKYGVIDEAYLDADKYPWLVFSGGIFKGGYNTLKQASTAVTELVKGADKAKSEAQILLRRDYSNAESSDQFMSINSIGGTVILDLGTNTFVRNGSFLDFKSDTTVADYDSTMIVRNGTIRTTKSAPCDFQYTATQTKEKTFDVIVEGVTFGFAENAKDGSSMDLIWVVWDNNRDNAGCNANITFNDCTIDLVTNAQAFEDYTTVNLFNFYDKLDRVDVSLTVNGGQIIAPDMSRVNFAKLNSGSDSVKMGRGSNGEYMSATLTGEGSVIDDNFLTVEGETRAFALRAGSENEYELVVNKLVTEYGTIPLAYSDVNAYPFAVFFDGEFVGAYDVWGNSDTKIPDALDSAKSLVNGTQGAGKTAYILLRRDYHTDSDVYYNLSQVGGTIALDLGENTFYVGNNDMFYAEGKLTNNQVHSTTVVVKNGAIRTEGSGTIVELRHASALTSEYKKNFFFSFDGVTFGLAQGSTVNQPLISAVNGKGNECYFDITMNNCIFDYSTVKPTSGITLFNLASSTDTNHVDLKVNGGTFKLETYTNITFYKLGDKDSLTMGRDENGKYPAVQTLSTTAPNKTVFDTLEGEAVFIEESDDGTSSVYRLMTVTYSNEELSGYTDSFFSGVDYPFAVFMNGKLATNGLKANYGQAIKRAKELTSSEAGTVEIMLRRDYSVDTDEDKTDANLKFINGRVVIDLNGYALTRGAQYILNMGTGDTCLYKTTVVIKNGTIHNSRQIFSMTNNGSTLGAKEYEIIFENVYIDSKKEDGRDLGSIFVTWTNKTGAGADISITFDNCTLDLRSAPQGVAVLDCDDKSVNAPVNVEIVFKGGRMLSLDMSKLKLFNGDAVDKLIFDTDSEGRYITLSLPKSADAPTALYNTANGGMAAFKATSVVGEYLLTELDDSELPCQHAGKYECSEVCDKCGEQITPVKAHKLSDATCVAKAKCSVCGKEEGDFASHIPNTDDGDCTTAVTCSVCGKETTPAEATHIGGNATCEHKAQCTLCGKEYGDFASHIPNADDGDCTTAVTCSVCGEETTHAEATHIGGNATCEHKAECTLCGKEYGDFASHIPNADDGDCTTAVTCSVCG